MKSSGYEYYVQHEPFKPGPLGWRVQRLEDKATLGWFEQWTDAVRVARDGFACSCAVVACEPWEWRRLWH